MMSGVVVSQICQRFVFLDCFNPSNFANDRRLLLFPSYDTAMIGCSGWLLCPRPRGGHFGIARSVRLSVPGTLAACSLATAGHQRCANCGPSADGRRSAAIFGSNCHRRGHVVSLTWGDTFFNHTYMYLWTIMGIRSYVATVLRNSTVDTHWNSARPSKQMKILGTPLDTVSLPAGR